jgi:peptidoglycan lytic transglycosylase A
MLSRLKLLCIMLMVLMITACEDRCLLLKHSFDNLPGWEDDNHSAALDSFKRSCVSLRKKKDQALIGDKRLQIMAGDFKRVCSKIEEQSGLAAKEFFEKNFVPHKVFNWFSGRVLFTGYYELELEGARERGGKNIHPVYALPSPPHIGFSREDITSGKLSGKGLELAYVADEIMLFFLHIQGSGVIKIDETTRIKIGYAGKNGKPYYPIGRHLVDGEGYSREEISAEFIIDWLKANPAKAKDVIEMNESYVFFREYKGEGPIGSQGVSLSAERSIAVDRAYIPMGAPVWISTNYPERGSTSTPLSKLVVAQDTGGAIKGPTRADIFFGFGDRAEKNAWHMNDGGSYYILLPRQLN